jgi:hypothetical protein
VIIAEAGLDMSRFSTAAHLASWAKFAPGVKKSAGKKKGRGGTGHDNSYLARVLGNCATAADKTDTFLGERYRRIARRRGKKKALVAVGRSLLVMIWHVSSDPDTKFCDLGADFYDTRIDPERRKRSHLRQLEALGFKVTLELTAKSGRAWPAGTCPRVPERAFRKVDFRMRRKGTGEPWYSESEHTRSVGAVGKGPAQQAPRWRPTQLANPVREGAAKKDQSRGGLVGGLLRLRGGDWKRSLTGHRSSPPPYSGAWPRHVIGAA